MYIRIKQRTNPLNVVTLDEARGQLNLLPSENDFDTHIQILIEACSELAEAYTRRRLSRCVILLLSESGEDGNDFKLPFGEVNNDDIVSVKDQEGNDVTYTFNEISQRIVLDKLTDVTIEYSAGYEDANIPSKAKLGILSMLNTFFNHREDFIAGLSVEEVPITSTKILDAIKLP